MTANAGHPRHAERSARALRHNHALVALARRVWSDDCTLQSAIALICQVAADTLEVERVNVWRVDRDGGRLHCLHAYQRSEDRHNPDGFDEVLAVDREYGEQLEDVRVIDIADVRADDTVAADNSLQAYFARHHVQSLLDAPVRCQGDLLGVVCHEQVGCARVWTPEDQAFAGSIGDYVAMAYEIDRRRRLENRVRYLELHDPHTNLPNRDHLLEVVHSALRPMHGDDNGLVAIHLQLDASPHDGDAGHDLVVDAADRLRSLLGGWRACAATPSRCCRTGTCTKPRR